MTNSTRGLLTMLLSLMMGLTLPAGQPFRVQAQVKPGAPRGPVPRSPVPGAASGGAVRPAAALSQNQAAANRNMRDRMPGANIPLGNLAVGSNGNFPWFLPFAIGYGTNGYGNYGYGYGAGGYGVTGSPAWANTSGYYGVGDGGFGPDNLAGGQAIDGSALGAATPPLARELPNSPVADKVQQRLLENEALYQFSDEHRMFRATQVARNREIAETSARIAVESRPRVLGTDEFDAANGRITWPTVLLTEDYQASRTAIEQALAALASQRGPETEAAIREAVAGMVAILRTHIEDLPADEYLTARKFLDSVEFTAHKSVVR